MSGFLHQLAARSLGLAPQIKSRAALPYAAPTADLSLADAANHESPPASAAIARPEAEPPLHARRNEPAMDSALPAPIVADIPDRAAARGEAPTAPPNTSQPRRIAAQPSPIDARPDFAPNSLAMPPAINVSVSPVTTERKPQPRHPEPAPETRQPPESPELVFTDLESLVTRLLGDQQSHSDKSPDTAAPPTVFTPRPASLRPAEHGTIRPQAGRERPAIAPETDTSPEVHITIGRLEVNPPSRPAPAAQPPRPRGPAPLSLSDYLARRNGGRS